MISVNLTDEGLYDYNVASDHFKSAADWAAANCKSFDGWQVVDVSDVSYAWDLIAEYNFTDEKDATMFMLKWK